MEELNNQSYWVVIPTKLFFENGTNKSPAGLYALISSLAKRDGYCYASNQFFAEVINVSNATIKRWLKKLEDQNLIRREYREDLDNNDKRKIYINGEWGVGSLVEPPPQTGGSAQKGGFLSPPVGSKMGVFEPQIKYINNISKDSECSHTHPSNEPTKEDKPFNKIDYYKTIENKFITYLEKHTKIKDYAFNYSKERTVIKRWTNYILKKHPNWSPEEIYKRLDSYFKHWFEVHPDENPSISKIFSANSLNDYRLWVAKNYSNKIFDSL